MSSNIAFLPQVLLFLAAMVGALAVYLLLRGVVLRAVVKSGKPGGVILSSLILPSVLCLAMLGLKLFLVRRAVPVNGRFGKFVDAALVFLLAFFVVRLVDAATQAWYARRHVPFPVPRVLRGFILGVIYLAALFAVLKGVMGVDISPFLTTSAILTMILGLALQGVLSNVLAGLSLHLTKSFSRGEWIKVKDIEGVVVETNWRETRVQDRAANIIVVPNSVIFSEVVTNFYQPDRKTALVFNVRASFSARPALVQEALLETARDMPEVLTSPAPLAFIRGFDDYGVSYCLKFWVTDFARKESILTKAGRLIWYKFDRRGIEIPVPFSERMAEMAGAVRKEAPEAGRDRVRVDNYRDLALSEFLRYPEGKAAGTLMAPEKDVRDFAEAVVRRRYTAGEVLFRQGDRGETCYVVTRGQVRGEIGYEENGKTFRSEFKTGPGGIIGEMSLFTGLPRTATCAVEEEAELLEIGAPDFARLLSRCPGLAESMSAIVAERNKRNAESLAKLKELSAHDLAAACSKKSILERLKGLIGLKHRP
jgi:small-conductance mechanosensitive channel/CRP-like cAMP-binding protein